MLPKSIRTTDMNPFIVSGKIPESCFCDRVEETKQLVGNLTNGRNTVLTSERRVGKTGLIEHCFDSTDIHSAYYTFFIDILRTSSLQEFVYQFGSTLFETLKPLSRKMMDLFVQTVRSVSGEIGYDPATNLPKFSFSIGALRNPEYTLEEIFRYISLADRHCIIAFDEFQQIVRYPQKNIEAVLRTHIQHCSNATFIYAGSERHILSEMFNSYSRPFYASTSMMSLDVLKEDVYTDFARRLFREADKDISEDAIAAVYDLFEGNTYCMQRTLNIAFERTTQGGLCTKDTVGAAVQTILTEQDHSYRMRMSLLTPKPKELLFAIAKDGHAQHLTSGSFVHRHHLTSSSSVQSAVKQLLAEDWITYTVTENDRIYKLSDDFLRLWIVENYGITDLRNRL